VPAMLPGEKKIRQSDGDPEPFVQRVVSANVAEPIRTRAVRSVFDLGA
jgi:hypothetical protein